MPESDKGSDTESHSSRSKMSAFLKDGFSRGKDELLKGKLMLQHTLGLGHKPNSIPPGDVIINGALRTVEIGWHPVGGFAGKWFAEKTGLGKKITEKINKYPDPTQHWGVLVDDYCHQLWMDEHLDVIYTNEKLDRSQWHTFHVGKTRFSDEALRQAGEMVIYQMRQKKPAYNLISNNCQNFALLLLDAIQIGQHKEFATSFAVYQTAVGSGKILDLFVQDSNVPEETDHNTVAHAAQVMEENTTKLDNHHHCC